MFTGMQKCDTSELETAENFHELRSLYFSYMRTYHRLRGKTIKYNSYIHANGKSRGNIGITKNKWNMYLQDHQPKVQPHLRQYQLSLYIRTSNTWVTHIKATYCKKDDKKTPLKGITKHDLAWKASENHKKDIIRQLRIELYFIH